MKSSLVTPPLCHTVSGHSDFVFQTNIVPKTTIPDNLILHRAHLPLCHLRYEVLRDGPTEAIFEAFDLSRLAGIHQLGYLSVVHRGVSEMNCSDGHHRLDHVFNVAAIASLIGSNNHLDARSMDTLRIAALTHDTLTPAGGDTTKTLDFDAFDEDAHYLELCERPKVRALLTHYKISPERLFETVLGQGILGKILDFADKIAYLARDVERYLSGAYQVAHKDRERIALNVRNLPNIIQILDILKIANDKVVVTDRGRLGSFLLLRGLMFRLFYTCREIKFRDFMAVLTVSRHLYAQKILTREKFLSINDEDFRTIIDETTGFSWWNGEEHFGAPVCETFDQFDSATARETELLRSGVVLAHYIHNPDPSLIKPLSTFYIEDKEGNHIPALDALPGTASYLRKLSNDATPHHIHYYPNLQIKNEYLDSLHRFLLTQSQK